MRKLQLTGQQFGYLKVLREVERPAYATRRQRCSFWLCLCECGKQAIFPGGDLNSGNNKHCGCKTHELFVKAHLTHGHATGGKLSSEYYSWQGMIARCTNPKNKAYRHYGGRGIEVCERWRFSFETFLSDMGRKPNPSLTIERINNDGHYEPANCKWASRSEQMRSRWKAMGARKVAP